MFKNKHSNFYQAGVGRTYLLSFSHVRGLIGDADAPYLILSLSLSHFCIKGFLYFTAQTSCFCFLILNFSITVTDPINGQIHFYTRSISVLVNTEQQSMNFWSRTENCCCQVSPDGYI
ncbi:hypothetical protein L1987_17247 [Smallanthus sonchifolius]|uniref:Uncharacterized protein n=1 Tax=Smallanthus sonchifolius TaxID=185202 RepID=A0ACB9IXG9_9ASTR|nr:hypothetical protein L1987_17247 [Smallanthus sonchifolius]